MEIVRRWLHFGPCENPTCTHNMWGEEGVRVTVANNGNIHYHHCCSTECAWELAKKTAISLRNAAIATCANPACQGLVIGGGIWGLVDVTTHNKEIYGPFCCPKCFRKHQIWLKRRKANLILAVDMRNRMMRPGRKWWRRW